MIIAFMYEQYEYSDPRDHHSGLFRNIEEALEQLVGMSNNSILDLIDGETGAITQYEWELYYDIVYDREEKIVLTPPTWATDQRKIEAKWDGPYRKWGSVVNHLIRCGRWVRT